MIISTDGDSADICLNATDLFVSSAKLNEVAVYLYLFERCYSVGDIVPYANSISYNAVKLALQAWLLESTGVFTSGDDLANLYAKAIEHGFPPISDSGIAGLDLLKRCGRSCHPELAMSEHDLAMIQGLLAFFSHVLNTKLS